MTFGIYKSEKAAEFAAFFILHFYLKGDGGKKKFFYNESVDEYKGAESVC